MIHRHPPEPNPTVLALVPFKGPADTLPPGIEISNDGDGKGKELVVPAKYIMRYKGMCEQTFFQEKKIC